MKEFARPLNLSPAPLKGPYHARSSRLVEIPTENAVKFMTMGELCFDARVVSDALEATRR